MYSSEFQAIIDKRRSNRKFDPLVEVPEEVIKRSLERAILSPNSSNMQLWEFYWIRSEDEKKKYEALCLGQNAARSAKEIVVFVTRDHHYMVQHFSTIQEGNKFTARVIGQRFELNDKYVSIIAELVEPKKDYSVPSKPKLIIGDD